MDAVCALATIQASLDQRLARAEATIEHSHAMLLRIMSHLGLPLEPTQTTRDQSTAVGSLDMFAAAAAASDPPSHPPPLDGRVIGIKKICFLCSSYYRSQGTAV